MKINMFHVYLLLGLSQKNGPGKNGPAGPILDEKMVWLDRFCSPKFGLAGPNLAAKNGPGRPKMVWPRKSIETSFNRLKWKEGPVYKPS